jgi:YD repeat-containing protein
LKVSGKPGAVQNKTGERYFGVDGKPALRTDLGIASITSLYDARGNKTDEKYFGLDGKPVPRKDTGIAHQTWSYDADGKLTSMSYFGMNGELLSEQIIPAEN